MTAAAPSRTAANPIAPYTHDQLMTLARIRSEALDIPWDGRSQRKANSWATHYDFIVRLAMSVGRSKVQTTHFAIARAIYGADVITTQDEAHAKARCIGRMLKELSMLEVIDYGVSTKGTGKSVGLWIELKPVPSEIDPGWVAQLVRAHDS